MNTVKDSIAEEICSFCGKSRGEVAQLVTGASGHICDECVDVCGAIVAAKKIGVNGSLESGCDADLPTPLDIKNMLDEYVIGQEYAKKVLSVAV